MQIDEGENPSDGQGKKNKPPQLVKPRGVANKDKIKTRCYLASRAKLSAK